MWFMKKAGPPRGMEPEEAFTLALIALAGYITWLLLFPRYGTSLW